MGMDPLPQIIIAAIALFLSAFFTLLKYSYENLNKYKVERMIDDEEIQVVDQDELYKLIEGINEVQSTFMISDYMSNAFTAATLAQVGYYYYKFPGMFGAIIIATILILVFGESAPYFVARAKGPEIAVRFMTFSKIYTRISSPLIVFIRSISKAIGSLFGIQKDGVEPKITEDQLFNAMNLSKDEGLLDKEEYGMIEKVVQFSDTFVKDVMTPRTDVVAIDIECEMEEILEVFQEERLL